MKLIKNGKIYHENHFLLGKVIIFSDTIQVLLDEKEYPKWQLEQMKKNEILEIEEIDVHGAYVVPGFIDVHIHGYDGVDTMEGTTEAIETIAKGIAKNGVTAFLPTTMTMEMSQINLALFAVREVMNQPEVLGAMVLGAHMEGPFINKEFKGAQSATHIRLPERSLLDMYSDVIRVITIAPEVEGALDLIKDYHENICFSIGHTGATYEEAMLAYQAGAKSATHLFNAMTGLKHREPGVVGAALTCDCYAEVIADGLHVNPVLFTLLEKAKGLQKLLLITDCMMAGGMDDGKYDLGGQDVYVKDSQCRLENGTLAGSVLKLNRGLENFSRAIQANMELEDAFARTIPLATKNQAEYLGVQDKMGTLDAGKLANIVLMNEDFEILSTFVKGKQIY